MSIASWMDPLFSKSKVRDVCELFLGPWCVGCNCSCQKSVYFILPTTLMISLQGHFYGESLVEERDTLYTYTPKVRRRRLTLS